MGKWQDIVDWTKEHRTEIAIGCLSVVGIGLCYHYRSEITGLFQDVMDSGVIPGAVAIPIAESPSIIHEAGPVASDTISESVTNVVSKEFDVSKHLRNLPSGWNPSPEKVASALANGFNLKEGQTWVDGYVKGSMAA